MSGDGDAEGDHQARTASWPASSTPTPTPVTTRPRSASRRSPPPTTWSATRPSARSTTRSAGSAPWAAGFGGPGGPGGPAAGSARGPAASASRAPTSATCSATSSAAAAVVGVGRGAPSRGRAPARHRPRGRAAPAVPRRRRRGHHHRCNLTSDVPLPHLPRLGRRARHRPDDLPELRRPRGARRQPGASSPSAAPCPVCGGARVGHRPTRAPPAAARASSGGPREVKVRIPAGRRRRPAHPAQGRGGAGRNGGPAGDLFVVVHVERRPAVRSRRRQPHPDRAGHLRRGRARRRRHACPPSTATPSPSGSRAGTRSGKHLPGARAGACDDHEVRAATCWSPSRSRCPPSSPTSSGRPSRPLADAPSPPSPARRTWGCEPMPDPTDPRTAADPGRLRHLGGRRAGRRAPADPAHLRAQGPARAGPHPGRQPPLQRGRHRPRCAASRSSPTRA